MEKNKITADCTTFATDQENSTVQENSTAENTGFFAKLKKKLKDFFTYNLPGKRPRVWELDLIRGLIMIVVTYDHIARFSYYWGIIHFQTAFGKAIGSVAVAYLNSYFCNHGYPYALWLLCFMSGISCMFSHSGISRVIKFWIFTVVFMGGYLGLHFVIPNLLTGYVVFNIVAVLTISVTVWYILEKLNVPDIYRIILGSVIIVAGVVLFYVNRFYNDGIFVKNDFLALLIYNKHGYEVSPNNFEPLIPHLGFFILGGVFGKRFYKDKTTKLKRKEPPKWLNPVMILGKHSLVAYLFLPTVCISLLWLLVQFVGLFL